MKKQSKILLIAGIALIVVGICLFLFSHKVSAPGNPESTDVTESAIEDDPYPVAAPTNTTEIFVPTNTLGLDQDTLASVEKNISDTMFDLTESLYGVEKAAYLNKSSVSDILNYLNTINMESDGTYAVYATEDNNSGNSVIKIDLLSTIPIDINSLSTEQFNKLFDFTKEQMNKEIGTISTLLNMPIMADFYTNDTLIAKINTV